MSKIKVYIAGGWFTDMQKTMVEEMEKAVDLRRFKVHSPRQHTIFSPDMDPQSILDENLKAIVNSHLILASTADKDMGTLFECGYAHSMDIPLIYYFPYEHKFNVMLAASALAVLQSEGELIDYFKSVDYTGTLHPAKYRGDME